VSTQPTEATTLRPGTPSDAGVSPTRVTAIANLARGWVEDGRVAALVVLAAHRGRIFLHKAFGPQTPDPDSPPIARDAIFPLASISKVLTATAIMTLAEEGRIDLNGSVAEYLPEFTGEGKAAVQVRHLLTHTSGLCDEDLQAHAEKGKGPFDIPPDEGGMPPFLYENLAPRWDAPLWKPPGEEMAYAGYNYRLLGEIVRRVSGASLAAFARARIFDPLGMMDSHFGLPDALLPRVVRRGPDAYDPDLDTARFQQMAWGSAGAFSTALDMATFGQMFLNRGAYGQHRILSPASVAAMTHDQLPGIQARIDNEFFPEASWGLGWSIHGRKTGWCGGLYSPQSFEHWGSGGVYLWVDPTYEVVGVYFGVVPVPETDPRHTELNDLFTDAVTAAIIDF
jgi:CubicO group peptidase (beta-lactamase class C family)